MFKGLILTLSFIFAMSAQASPLSLQFEIHKQMIAMIESLHGMALDWKVGDTASYDLNVGDFIKGSMVMTVKSIDGDGIWLNQDADLGFAGKQEVQELLDPTTGAIKKMIANGQEQQIPKQDLEVIDTIEEQVTVPAGTFSSIHVRAKDKSNNDGEVNAWLNPQLVPVGGALKQSAPTQFGVMTMELNSFKKN